MRKQEGAITVFLSIVLLIFITMAGIIVDGTRMRAADIQVKRALETSVRSVLADYDSNLKEDYGLFALSDSDMDALKANIKTEIEEYMNKNLRPDSSIEGNYFDLYDYKVEDITVEPYFILSKDVDAAKQQILEYSKFRAPKEMIERFLSILEDMKKAGEISEAIEQTVTIDEKLDSMNEKLTELIKLLDETNRYSVNWFPLKFTDDVENWVDYVRNYHQIAEEKDYYEEKANNQFEGLKSAVKKGIENTDKALSLINELEDNVKSLREDINALKDKLEHNDAVKETKESIQQSIQQAEDILKMIEEKKNIDTLQHNKDALKSIKSVLESTDNIPDTNTAENVNQNIKSTLNSDYSKILQSEIDKAKQNIPSKRDFPEKDVENIQKELEEFAEFQKKEIPDYIMAQLPSRQGSNASSRDISFNIGPKNINFLKNNLASMKKYYNILTQYTLRDLRDDLFINEYILMTFNNWVKNDKQRFFRCETEYILNGSRFQSINFGLTVFKIFSIRFIMGLIDVYSDVKKHEEALAWATGIAAALGWLFPFAPAAVPVIKQAVLCFMAAEEAIKDVRDLISTEDAPKKVPFIRINGKSLGVDADYADHLRLLLLFDIDNDKKVRRILDLIQVGDMGPNGEDFKYTNYISHLKVKATVSIKYLFLSQPFIPSQFKMPNGRYKIEAVVYQGY
jgi:hypothetical protein